MDIIKTKKIRCEHKWDNTTQWRRTFELTDTGTPACLKHQQKDGGAIWRERVRVIELGKDDDMVIMLNDYYVIIIILVYWLHLNTELI